MADGRSMNIEQVRVGDRVLAFDDDTLQVKSARVLEVLVHPDGSHQDGLYLVNGKIHATSNHAFFVNGEWKQLKDVRLGDTVYSLAGDRACPSTVAPEKVESIERLPDVETVYNLEIERYHTYFVHGVLVHNYYKVKKAPPRPSPSGDYSAARKEEPKAELDPDLGRRR
jgi:intein/homing endonuclease